MQYRKKPITIEAFKYGHEKPPEWFDVAIDADLIRFPVKGADIQVVTLEGPMNANAGDYIIKGVKGELYPCKGEIFEETYERVGE